MADIEELGERVAGVEKMTSWLEQRVWTGTGNLHDRVHVLEDKNGDRVHEISNLQSNVAKIERVLGLGDYGERNIMNDLRDAIDTIQKIKEGIISIKDFQTLLNKVDRLEKQGQAQISFWNYVVLAVVSTVISIVVNLVATRLIAP